MNTFPEKSLELIVSEVKKAFLSEEYQRGCVFLNHSREFVQENLLVAVQEYIKEGFINQLLNLFNEVKKFNGNEMNLKNLVLEIFTTISSEMMEMGMVDEVELIFKEYMKFIRSNPISNAIRSLNNFIYFINKVSNSKFKQKPNFSEDDFGELIEFLLKNYNRWFFLQSSLLLENNAGVHKELTGRLIDKLIGILASVESESMMSPFFHFADIVKFMKLDFKPWMSETIKLTMVRITDVCHVPESGWIEDDLEAFLLLKSLIAVFREDCEIYISKYKIVSLMINFMTQRNGDVRISFEFKHF
jgi:hypothetical protein